MVALVFILFQNGNDARQLLKHLYPTLGKPIPHSMHTYDDNCEFELANIVDNLDHYFAIHVVNWFVVSLIVRDAYVLHFWSILDELLGFFFNFCKKILILNVKRIVLATCFATFQRMLVGSCAFRCVSKQYPSYFLR